MRFLVSNQARDLGIANPVVCLYRGVAQVENTDVYNELKDDLMSRIDHIRTEVVPTDAVQGFRKLYANVNSKVQPAGERLVETCKKKGVFPNYGNLVDAYNIVAF
ncbi:MAG: hypothetical protein JSR46_08735, partial [Verrucomicrobia bacterium]|nr:hypothetical protein [Verrucomicrobiota bacterium]